MTQPPRYQIIPRKYRPQKFDAVVGQEAIVTTLQNALRFKRVSHAYLFSGPRGSGKTTLARLFAKAINCHALTDQEPCEKCPSCLEIKAGRSLDLIEIDGASNRGIDDIRTINENVQYAPSSNYKIYLIDEVHMLTKEAFNALLKTLEEPPSHIKFFFATTEAHKVPATILSRCQRFDLRLIPEALIVSKLHYIVQDMKRDVEEEAFKLIAEKAEGSLRDAESLLDQILCCSEGRVDATSISMRLGLVPRIFFEKLDVAINGCDLRFALESAQDLFESGKDPALFLERLVIHFRTHLLNKTGHPEARLVYILDYLTGWLLQSGKMGLKRIALEMILLHLVRSRDRVTIDSLVMHLSELEKKLQEAPLQVEKKTEEQAPVLTKPAETIVVPPAVEKIVTAVPLSPPAQQTAATTTPPTKITVQRHETILRFAAVELEGTIKRS